METDNNLTNGFICLLENWMQQAMTLLLKLLKLQTASSSRRRTYRMPPIGAIRFATGASMDHEKDDTSLLKNCRPTNNEDVKR